MSSMRPSGEKSRRSKLRKPTIPFSIALPTTPTLTAASTASGKTQNTSRFFMTLAFGGSYHDTPRPGIQVGNVLQREGDVEIPATLFAYHEHFVGGRLESVAHHAENLAVVVERGQPDEVSHVVFVRPRAIEFVAADQEFLALKRIHLFPAPDPLHVDQEPFRRLPGSRDTTPRTTHNRLHPFPEVPPRTESPNPQSPAHPVRSDHDPYRHRIGHPGSFLSLLPTPRPQSGPSVGDLHGNPLALLHGGRLHHRTDGAYRAPLATDHAPHVVGRYPELQIHPRVRFRARNLDRVGLVDERAGEDGQQVL